MAPGGIQHPGRAVRQGGPEYQLREDIRNSLPPVPVGRNSVGGGVWDTYYGSGAFQLGEAAGLVTVHRVWGGDGDRVAGGPHADTSWEGSGWETELVNRGPRWGAIYLQDGLPDRRGAAELPHQGVYGTGGNEDGDAGSFLPPACPGYRHHCGGGKPPPPMVPPMQHAGSLACNEREAPCHRPVRQGGGEEAQAAGG